LDARGADESSVRACVAALSERVQAMGGELVEESWTGETCLDTGLVSRLARLLDGAPVLPTGAGHDAGILSNAGVASVMLFVRNPSGISHSPAEFAERADCLAGVAALTHTVTELTR